MNISCQVNKNKTVQKIFSMNGNKYSPDNPILSMKGSDTNEIISFERNKPPLIFVYF